MKHLARRIQKWDELEKTSLEDVLKGAPVENPMKWPPQMDAEGLQLEETNTITHHYPLRVLLNHYNFRDTRKLLDVGGGEATISCGLAKKYPHLHCTVYNLINTQKSAETNIKQNRLEKQVDFVVGDFVKDTSFPKGYDVILFSRVLWNWSSEMNLKQLQMAYDALEPGGTVLIVEAFSETNLNFALYMQYRQFFWDDFPPGAFKYSSEYKEMLKIIGFKNILYSSSPTSIFSLMTAEKPKKDHL